MYIIILGFIAIGSLLLWYFLSHDHGRNLPVGSLWLAFGFGVLASFLAYNLESRLFPKDILTSPVSMGAGLLLFLGVGFLEEAVKFIPLAIFIYHKPYFKEHTDGVIYFVICGLTFGLCENILYTISFGSKVGMVRLIISPFFHAAATSILGYYLVSMKINKKVKKRFILACLIIPIMHGVYDFGLVTGKLELNVLSFMLTLLLTMGLFLYFMSANDLDKAALIRLKSAPNNFCSNCGKPNVNHTLFCVYCGHHL